MVKLIFEDKWKYRHIIQLLESMFNTDACHGCDWFTIITSEFEEFENRHEYCVHKDGTIKIKGHNLLIISDRICSVIDLRKERLHLIKGRINEWQEMKY